MYRTIRILAGALLLLVPAGCLGPKYEPLAPRLTGEYGAELLGGRLPEGSWHWVRGRVLGDIDNAKSASGELAEEEVILVTVQRGDPANPGPAVEAVLQVVDRSPLNQIRELRARRTIFSLGEADEALPLPRQTLGVWTAAPVDQGRIDLADLDGDGTLEILVSLWTRTAEGVAAIHQAFRLDGRNLVPVFGCRALQPRPELLHRDIDKDGVDEIIVPSAILPPRAADAPRSRPVWPSIYTRGAGPVYQQDNASFGEYYDPALVSLYEDMTLASLAGEPVDVQSLYLGLIYSYRGDRPMARRLLGRAAAQQGTVGDLARAALEALPASGSAQPQDASAAPPPAPQAPAPAPAAPPVKRRSGPEPKL